MNSRGLHRGGLHRSGTDRGSTDRRSLSARAPWALVLACCVWCGPAASADAVVEFELVTEPSFPIAGAQAWIDLFARLEQGSIRIRPARPGDQERVENRGTRNQPRYYVLGVLTGRNRLILPGGEFGVGDRGRLEAWIKRVQAEGETAPTKTTTVFGLTAEQLVDFHEHLAKPITFSTVGRRAGDVARDIVGATRLKFTVTEAARKAFQSRESIVADELRPLSGGTVLAAALRPLGLVMHPQLEAGMVQLRIGDASESAESWPVGWPPQEIPGKVAPKLFEYLPVTITEHPLPEALAAIQQRVQIPFLLDHQAIARRNIDPAAAKVSYTKERASYQKVVDNLLFQARLSSELRVDEAGQPLLWITPR